MTRQLANAKHFPAIDVLGSISRVRDAVITREHLEAARTILQAEAAYHAQEDLISVGAYMSGSDPYVDAAIALRSQINSFLRQEPDDYSDLDEVRSRLLHLAGMIEAHLKEESA